MKKQYMKPQTEVMKVETSHVLAGSVPGWGGEAGSRDDAFFDDWDEE